MLIFRRMLAWLDICRRLFLLFVVFAAVPAVVVFTVIYSLFGAAPDETLSSIVWVHACFLKDAAVVNMRCILRGCSSGSFIH